MERDHTRWRELILCHEDLEGPARVEADSHLAGCSECRALLARVQAAERSPRPRGMLPPFAGEAAPLAPGLRAEADRSLRSLRERLGLPRQLLPRDTGRARPRARSGGAEAKPAWRRLAVPLALAAGVAFVALVTRPDREQEAVRGLRILPYAADRGAADSVATSPRVTWRTGDAFVLVFDLARPSHPVVFHLGPDGEFSLLHPADPAAPVPRLPAGRGLKLPSPATGETWILEGAPGPEAFMLATADRADPPLAEILARAQALAAGQRRRQRLLTALVELLAADLGPVQTVEIEHVP